MNARAREVDYFAALAAVRIEIAGISVYIAASRFSSVALADAYL
jgi:hypothetical protein